MPGLDTRNGVQKLKEDNGIESRVQPSNAEGQPHAESGTASEGVGVVDPGVREVIEPMTLI